MTGLAHRENAGFAPDIFAWLDGPFVSPRPVAAQAMRMEEQLIGGRYVVRAELPGVDPAKDMEVSVAKGILTIRAERREDLQRQHRSEFRYRTFSRHLPLLRVRGSRPGGRQRAPPARRRLCCDRYPVKHSTTDAANATTPVIHVAARRPRQAAIQNFPHKWITISAMNSSTLHRCKLLKKCPTGLVCHQSTPPRASANPDTTATPSAARLATPNTYTQEAT